MSARRGPRKKASSKTSRKAALAYTAKTERRLICDLPHAMKECLVVEHRDQRGKTVPLELNNCQTKLHTLIENIRALNILRNTTLHDEKAAICFNSPINLGYAGSTGLRTRIREVVAYGVDELLLDLQEKRPDLYLSDGPARVAVTKCRRGGVSSYLEGRAYLTANNVEGFGAFVMAHRGPNARRVFKYAADFYKYWNPRYEAFRKDSESERKDGYAFENNSRFTTATSGGDNAARGDQFDYYHFSETAFYDDYEEVKVALAGRPGHAFIFEESTGNGPQGGFYNRAMSAMTFDDVVTAYVREDAETLSKWNGYFLFFFGWLEDPAYREKIHDWEETYIAETVDDDEKILLKMGADYEQLKWRRTRIAEFAESDERNGLPPDLFFAQEYPHDFESCFISSATKWFDPRVLKRQLASTQSKRPNATVIIDSEVSPVKAPAARANFIVHKRPVKGRYYVIGADIAQGLKHGDWSVAIVLDYTHPGRAEEVAMVRMKTPAPAFGEVLCTLGEWYNTAYMVPEINGPGLATCQRVVDNRYPRLYHRQTLDMVKSRWGSGDTFRFGFSTNNATKGRILSDTQDAIRKSELLLRSPVAIREHMAFEAQDGKYKAPEGLHDDCVIAAALAYFGISRAPRMRPKKALRMYERPAGKTDEDVQKDGIYDALMRKVARDARKYGLTKESVRDGAKKPFKQGKRSL